MKRASIALAAALIASSGCIIEKTSADVVVYWAAAQEATVLEGADRVRVRVTGLGAGGDERELASASFSADGNSGHLKIPFGEGIVVHVEVLDGDGNIISYGASRRHNIASPDTDENDLDPGWELPPDEIAVFIGVANSTTNTVTAGGLPAYGLAERWGHTATPLPDGRILIVGGATIGNPLGAFPYGQIAENTILATIELFDPENGTFTGVATPTMNFDVLSNARAFHSATLLDDGSVLILGGYSFIDNTLVGLRTAETFDLDSCDFSGGTFAVCNTALTA